MGMFHCERCGVRENTALGRYWLASEKLCSLCASGKWHGAFPRRCNEHKGMPHDCECFEPRQAAPAAREGMGEKG